MIRTLQKKFVITAMIAITALLLVLLGAINVVNIGIVGNDTEKTLRMIAENQGDIHNLNMQPGIPNGDTAEGELPQPPDRPDNGGGIMIPLCPPPFLQYPMTVTVQYCIRM